MTVWKCEVGSDSEESRRKSGMQRRVSSVGVWKFVPVKQERAKVGGKQGCNDVELCEISFSTNIELLLSEVQETVR